MSKHHFYTSTQIGSPLMNGTAGTLISVLDACLINGFGLKTVDAIKVLNNVAVATISTGHGFLPDTSIEIAGATPAGLNGKWRVTSNTTTTVTFSVTGVADGDATGTMTAKVPPLGWTKVYSGTNLGVYKSSSPESTGFMLRVDDTVTTYARVRAYESMTDINTGTGPFPTDVQFGGSGLYWRRSNIADSSSRRWAIVGDDRIVYVMLFSTGAYPNKCAIYCFGDPISFRGSDPFLCYLSGYTSDYSLPNSSACMGYSSTSGANNTQYVARALTGIGGSQLCSRQGTNAAGSTWSGLNGYQSPQAAYPNPSDFALLTCPVTLFSDSSYRARFPGILHCTQNLDSRFSNDDIVNGAGDYAGRRLRVVVAGPLDTSASNGVTLFDMTGPWR